MIGTECGTQEPVTGLGHELSSACLRSKAVATLDILIHLLSEVLLNDLNLAVWHLLVIVTLQIFQLFDKYVKGS